MFKCKECSYEGDYVGKLCPYCHKPIVLTRSEIENKRDEADKALKAHDYNTAAEALFMLADTGIAEYEREYATVLERGEIVELDIDGAMKYFALAAEKNDAVSAYHYSRLVSRHNDKTSDFWLRYSAVLGCIEAYPRLAEVLSREGDEESATYFYTLAALSDDVDSIVTMAKRCYDGIGTEKSSEHAKWYMDKLTIPPINAIKLAYRLRSVKAVNPGSPVLPDYDRLLRRLTVTAHDLGFNTAYHRLCSILSDRGDIQARMILGMLYADGIGCTANAAQAISLLDSASAHGSAEAAKHLGDIYLVGRIVEQNAETALVHYRRAADLGMTNAYENMGDIYNEGNLVEKNIARAIELYDLAAKEGYDSARRKAETLKRRREEMYDRAVAIEETAPESAFKCYAVSAGMGYLPAYSGLAHCFLNGIGTECDRARAYVWYTKAVEEGDREALYPLALCYSRGIGTEFNFTAAVKLLNMARRLGSAEAEKELVRLLENKKRHMTRVAYAKGMELIYMKKFKAAEKVLFGCLKASHPKGIYTLGCLNEFGLGMSTNRERAFKLYECAYDLGFRDPDARYKLKVLRMARDKK